MSEVKLAVILIRGRIGFKQEIKDTLDMLRLYNKHNCVIIPENKVNLGMLQKVKDAVTWGTIDAETEKELLDKRGKKDSEGNVKKTLTLNPPRGGFERKGIKTPFGLGGALGNRKEKINDLIKKML